MALAAARARRAESRRAGAGDRLAPPDALSASLIGRFAAVGRAVFVDGKLAGHHAAAARGVDAGDHAVRIET